MKISLAHFERRQAWKLTISGETKSLFEKKHFLVRKFFNEAVTKNKSNQNGGQKGTTPGTSGGGSNGNGGKGQKKKSHGQGQRLNGFNSKELATVKRLLTQQPTKDTPKKALTPEQKARKMEKMKCFKCNNLGHMKKDCTMA